ncbi:MAG: triose-phosphate isomerase [Microthrixaceae bacterium]|nr:triose-phosphate isomerase [Microthrixaceae bacterium]MCO5314084.1 triose-phosphate isomerase [Microthrixaceae bacterium]HPB45605.1 triose-phosphate isomerase [Microthrixaceae bacterium]
MPKRIPIISGNWKMNLNHLEALTLVQKLSYNLAGHNYDAVEVTVHPPFVDIRTVQTAIESDRMSIVLGAQNCYFEEKGAFTGEVAPSMLAKLNVSYVILGHSERREIFGETDEMVNKKVHAVFKAGMTPILCCGETQAEREGGEAEAKVGGQIRAGLAKLSTEQVASMVIAYEPIWAIGTGLTATPDDAQAMCKHVRTVVAEVAGQAAADAVRIQYGGSVKGGNASELMAQPDIDGALVGGAALDADDFARIVQFR